MKTIVFNVNDCVLVKLTDAGKRELYRRWLERGYKFEYTPPTEDSCGWSRWQMWTLMADLGHMLDPGVGGDFLPFATHIKLEVREEVTV